MKTSLRLVASLTIFFSVASAVWAGEKDGLSEGQAAFNAGNYKLSFAKWSELATTGHSDAQVFIGLSYANGWGVAQNPKLASMWYQKAANSENPSGQFLLGLYYITSDNRQEVATGLMWLRRSAANGDDSARRFLERARERGWFKDLATLKSEPVAVEIGASEQVAVVSPSEAQ